MKLKKCGSLDFLGPLRKRWPDLDGHVTEVKRGSTYAFYLYYGLPKSIIWLPQELPPPEYEFSRMVDVLQRLLVHHRLGRFISFKRGTPHCAEVWLKFQPVR